MAIVNNLVMQIDGQNIVVYPNTVGRAVYINESNGYNLIQALNDIRANAISEWTQIQNKPFASIGSDFIVVDGRLQLNGSLSMEWNDIQNKPQVYNSSWGRISGKPDSYPSTWNDITNMPEYFPTEWNYIVNKPANYGSSWENIENKPDYFPTNWELVENRPENLVSNWEDIQNKPFETLDNYYLHSDENNVLSILNVFNFVNYNQYNNITNEDANYYIVYNLNFQNGQIIYNASTLVSSMLPQLRGIKRIDWGNAEMYANVTPAKFAVAGNYYYYPSYNEIYSNNYINNTYLNTNMDYFSAGEETVFYNTRIFNTFNFDKVRTLRQAFKNAHLNFGGDYGGSSYLYINFTNNASTTIENKMYQAFYNANFISNANSNKINGVYLCFSYQMGLEKDQQVFDYVTADYLYLNASVWNNYPFNNLRVNTLHLTPALNTYYSSSTSLTNSWNNVTFRNCIINYLIVDKPNQSIDRYYYINSVINTFEMRRQNRCSVHWGPLGNGYGFTYKQFILNNVGSVDIDSGYYNNRLSSATLTYVFDNCYSVSLNGRLFSGNVTITTKGSLQSSRVNCHVFEGATITDLAFISRSNVACTYYPFNNTSFMKNGYNYVDIRNRSENSVNNVPSFYIAYSNINFYHGFDGCKFLKEGVLYQGLVNADYMYNNCIYLEKAVLPGYFYNLYNVLTYYSGSTVTRNLIECFANCPNLTSIEGGGYYDETNSKTETITFDSMNRMFYNSNLLADVEFNLFCLVPCNAANLFGGTESSYLRNKSIHILGGSTLDGLSMTEPYFIENNPSLNASNITILSNGRYFNDYHLYIYNDIQSPAKFFRSIYGTLDPTNELYPEITSILLSDVRYTTAYNEEDENLINLGPWDAGKDANFGIAYLNTVSDVLYLSKTTSSAEQTIYFLDNYNSLTGMLTNVQDVQFLSNVDIYSGNNSNYLYRTLNFNNSGLTRGWNYKSAMMSLGYPSNLQINNQDMTFAITYANCPNLTNIGYMDNHLVNMSYMFYNCANLVDISRLNVKNVRDTNFYYAFANCPNIINAAILSTTLSTGSGIWGYMYNNCCNLINGYIGPSCYSGQGVYNNCINLTKARMDFTDPNSFIYSRGSSYWEYMFNNCRKLEYFKCDINKNILPGAGSINFGYGTFNNCKFLVYMPLIPVACRANSYGVGDTFANTNNIVVMQIGNVGYRYNNGSVNGWVNRCYVNSYYGSFNNITIASYGNGAIAGYNDYNGYSFKNLVFAAMPEDVIYTDTNEKGYMYNNCHNLIYGQFFKDDNFAGCSGAYYFYNNCSNLLIPEINDMKRINLEREKKSNNHSYIPQNLNYAYGNCRNLVYAIASFKTSLYYCYNNCNNLIYAACGNHNSGYDSSVFAYSYDNCVNLLYPACGDLTPSVYYCYNNCPNLLYVACGNNTKSIYGSYNDCGIPYVNINNTCVNLINIYGSFFNCNKIQEVHIDCPKMQSGIQWTMHNCPNITKVYLNYDAPYCQSFCNNCINITDIEIRGAIYGGDSSLSGAFNFCPNVKNVVIDIKDTSNICQIGSINSTWLYNSVTNLENLSISADNAKIYLQYFYNLCNLHNASFTQKNNGMIDALYSSGMLFFNCINLTSVTGELNFVSNASQMFYNCQSLEEPFDNINNIGTPILYYMYYNCRNLKNVSSITAMNMTEMYEQCYNIKNSICGDNTIYMDWTYSHCANLLTASCGPNVVSMADAYYNCTNLQEFNIGKNVVSMYYAYYNCFNIPSNISINAVNCNWMPVVPYRENTILNIHIYQNSNFYNMLNEEEISYTTIYCGDCPTPDSVNYNIYAQKDAVNNRFYYLQPNVQLYIYYDLTEEGE